jgi:hypothetical protein
MHMSWRDDNFEHQALRINQQVTLAAIDLLETVIAGDPPFSLVLTLWLSMIAPLGVAQRPTARRSFSRRRV